MTPDVSTPLNLAASLASTLTRDANYIEVVLLLVCLALASRWARQPSWLDRLETLGVAVAHRTWLAYGSILLLSVGPRIALLHWRPYPDPSASDEFSHRFLADTLLQGRLSNPTHPLWIHFETIHIFHQPTYSSMYFPLQGIFLAAGKLLGGHHWWGVVLSSATMAAAILWMLRGWFSPSWAFAGACMAVPRLCVASYWMDSYWGGFVAATAGALVAGAFPRLSGGWGARFTRRPTWIAGLMMALGLAMLASSRPYEGLVMSVCFCAVLAWRFLRTPGGQAWRWGLLVRGALPVAIVLSLTAAGLMIYFKHVTGSPMTVPYTVNQRTYGWPMTLAWFQPHAANYRHKELSNYFEYELDEHRKITTSRGLLEGIPWKLEWLWRFYFGPALTVPLLFMGAAWRSRRTRLLVVAGVVTAFAVVTEQSAFPHYLAPATACITAIVVQSLRAMRVQCRMGRLAAFQMSRAIPAVVAAVLLLHIAAPHLPGWTAPNYHSWCCSTTTGRDRAGTERQLMGESGGQLVFVRYSHRDKNNIVEWVYNDPDIDRARIVWARDMGDEENRPVLERYRDRRAWLVEPDAKPVRITPYLPVRNGMISSP